MLIKIKTSRKKFKRVLRLLGIREAGQKELIVIEKKKHEENKTVNQ